MSRIRKTRHLSARVVSLVFCALLPVLAGAASASDAAEPVPVRAARFADIAVDEQASVPASVVARNAPSIAAEIDARIVAIPVLVGQRITRGEVLARLDCRRVEAALASAAADLERAKALQRFATQQLDRARDLRRKQSISDEVFDQRSADLASARADSEVRSQQLELARLDVANCELSAPFDGVVTARLASVGSYVNRGSLVIAMTEIGSAEISAALRHPQADTLSNDAAPAFHQDERRYPVALRAIVAEIDPVTRTREARLAFTGESALPGSAGRLVWQTGRSMMPADLLTRRDGQLGVFVLDGEYARFHPLPGAEEGRPAAATLPAGTQVITDGRQRLSDGDPVRRIGDAD